MRVFSLIHFPSSSPSAYILSHLGFSSEYDSPMFIFNDNSIIDLDKSKRTFTTSILNESLPHRTWLGQEFELAYDPEITNLDGVVNNLTFMFENVNSRTLILEGEEVYVEHEEPEPLITSSFPTPGSMLSSIPEEYKPLYNRPLGVFNVIGKPQIEALIDNSDSKTQITLDVDKSSYTVINNPVLEVLKIVSRH